MKQTAQYQHLKIKNSFLSSLHIKNMKTAWFFYFLIVSNLQASIFYVNAISIKSLILNVILTLKTNFENVLKMN